MKKILALLLFAACFPSLAYSGQKIDTVRVLCLPEKGLERFLIDGQAFHNIDDYVGNGGEAKANTTREDRSKILESHGLLPATDFSYTCSLLADTYKVSGTRPPHQGKGMCGGDPRVKISLTKNGEPILRNVFFESSCLGHKKGHLKSINIDGALENIDTRFTFTVSDGKLQKQLVISEKQVPVTQEKIDCLIDNGFLESLTESKAIKLCIQ